MCHNLQRMFIRGWKLSIKSMKLHHCDVLTAITNVSATVPCPRVSPFAVVLAPWKWPPVVYPQEWPWRTSYHFLWGPMYLVRCMPLKNERNHTVFYIKYYTFSANRWNFEFPCLVQIRFMILLLKNHISIF